MPGPCDCAGRLPLANTQIHTPCELKQAHHIATSKSIWKRQACHNSDSYNHSRSSAGNHDMTNNKNNRKMTEAVHASKHNAAVTTSTTMTVAAIPTAKR